MSRKIISIVFGILVLAGNLSACTKEETVYLDHAVADSEATEEITPDVSTEPAFCCVYVCGAVKKPGVYTLPQDARVCDALEAAGGFAEEASREAVNLAGRIQDAQQIWIPTAEEAAARMGSGGESELMPGGTDTVSGGGAADGRININTAGKEELMTIPGIGESKAESVIAYRREHGSFADIRDIMNIAGIKEGIFEKIKDSITVN